MIKLYDNDKYSNWKTYPDSIDSDPGVWNDMAFLSGAFSTIDISQISVAYIAYINNYINNKVYLIHWLSDRQM